MTDHRELLLRCDCGVEHMDIDIWIQPAPAPVEGYLSFTTKFGGHSLRQRLLGCWTLLRGREYLLNELLLTPDSTKRLREFFADFP